MKKIFPLKLSEDVYQDLRTVAEHENVSMSDLVRGYFAEDVKKKAKKIKLNKKPTLLELADKFAYSGKTYHNNKSDDELLYGEK